MKCAAPGCKRARILLVGVCLPHWKTLTAAEQEEIERTWLNLQICHNEQNESAFHEALLKAFPRPPEQILANKKAIKVSRSTNPKYLSRIKTGWCVTCGKQPAMENHRKCCWCEVVQKGRMKFRREEEARRQHREGKI